MTEALAILVLAIIIVVAILLWKIIVAVHEREDHDDQF